MCPEQQPAEASCNIIACLLCSRENLHGPAILRFSIPSFEVCNAQTRFEGCNASDRLTGCIVLLAAVEAAAAWSIIAGQLKSRCLQNCDAAWLRQLYCAYCQHVTVGCRGNRCSAVVWHNTAAGRPHHGLCHRQCQPPSHCCWYPP